MTTSLCGIAAGFRRWRRSRPFWGGLWVTLGGLAVLLAPLAPLPFIVHQGVAGVSGYLVGGLLATAGVLSWWRHEQRCFLGVVATGLSLASFVTSNLGGFGLGMALGVVGGALLVAWHPTARADAPARGGGGAPPTGSDAAADGGRSPDRWRGVAALSTALPLLLHGQAAMAPHAGPPSPTSAEPGAAATGEATRGGRGAEGESGLRAATLTMTGARFHGVTDRPTPYGPRAHLKLSMDTVAITDGEHWFRRRGVLVRQRFAHLRLSGGVVMYVTRLRMRLAGVGVTVTPALPPPVVPPAVTVSDLEAGRPLVVASRAAAGRLAQDART
ncbi:DUF6114 domain-containing protein [Nonomuraea sp. NPDC047897]|uniref:DUF6114 domain-containing protein n=1 Tax=Nonomuraea sp. NPDC047897 TaxID=3364346 RepID=UPI00371AC4EC